MQDRFVVIAPKRGKRPHDVPVEPQPEGSAKDDPFSKDEAYETITHEVPDGDGGWLVRSIPNAFPALQTSNPNAYGTQEVVIETPEYGVGLSELSTEHVSHVLKTYAARCKAMTEDPKIKYVLAFKNRGGKAGASLRHAHSQIYGMGFVPPHIEKKLGRLRAFRDENGIDYYEHLFNEEENGPRHIWSDDRFLAFAPYASIYPYEAWLLPRRHVDNISLLDDGEIASLAEGLLMILKKLDEHGFAYNFYMHQTVDDDDEHFYLRVAPRTNTWAGVELGSRLIINPMSPEEAAAFYRS